MAILVEAPFFALVAFALGLAVTLCVIGLVTYLYSRLYSRHPRLDDPEGE